MYLLVGLGFRMCVFFFLPGVLDIPMISWVVMLVSRLLDYVASIEDEASGGKKHLGGKERERTFTGIWTARLSLHSDEFTSCLKLTDDLLLSSILSSKI